MTYGIELINAQGVNAIDMNNQVLRVYDSGTTVEQYNAYETKWNEVFQQKGTSNIWGMQIPYSSSVVPYYPIITSPSQTIEVIDCGANRWALVPSIVAGAEGGWSAFYQLSTPVGYSLETELDQDPSIIPSRTYCMVEGTRPYKLTAPVSKTSYTENYGLQVFNASGAKVFDSRDDYLSVRYAFIIPRSIVEDVLTNGTTKVITLPEAMPNAWFSIPMLFCSEVRHSRTTATGHYFFLYRVQIQQTSATEVTVSRFSSGELFWAPRILLTPYYTHDIVVFVARDPT